MTIEERATQASYAALDRLSPEYEAGYIKGANEQKEIDDAELSEVYEAGRFIVDRHEKLNSYVGCQADKIHRLKTRIGNLEQQMIHRACIAYCKVCAAKECKDYECSWFQEFERALKKTK